MESGNIFNDLNEHQIHAVTATEGRIKVVAGAGSGKTRVLAHRFAYLVNDVGISPSNIVCMTFTNKAAQEMKQRIVKMVDRGDVNDFICTIHGFCVKLLRREIYRIGYPKTFTIIDEEDAKTLAKQAMDEFGLDRRKQTTKNFLEEVAALKSINHNGYINDLILPGNKQKADNAKIRYIQLQLKHFCLDYDDLIYFTLYILTNFKDANDYWTDKLNYLMVDEVQDCSTTDWELLELLSKKHGNLFVVGDPDQAIYEWRGAKPKQFVDFKADAQIILSENYRSTPQILDIANSIITNNRNRIPKDLFTKIHNGLVTTHFHARSEKDEAVFIAKKIAERVEQSDLPYSSFAILYRASFLSRTVEQALLRHKIPYSVWGGIRFYERREIKDTLAYLRLAASSEDDLSFRRIINVPSRKFGKASMSALQAIAERDNISLYNALRNNIGQPPFRKSELASFISIIEETKTLSEQLPVSELTNQILKSSGLLDAIRKDEDEDRLENITELINSMKEYEVENIDEPGNPLTNYLQDVALYTNADHDTRTDAVRLMTIHQAKGLEFPEVFITGLTEGIFPSHRTIRERRSNGEEEERRLMYVAVTRARKRLYLSESEGFINENGALKYPSRFIAEIPEQLITHEGEWDPTLMQGTRGVMHRLDDELGVGEDLPFSVGDEVIHKIFGVGTIEAYNKVNNSYTVRFGESTRSLLPHVLTLPQKNQ
jgi:DNA helicase-2/ATP-dependent DNA helicase PcrA